MQVCDRLWLVEQVLHHPLRLQHLLAAFEGAFAFDLGSVSLLLHAAAPDSGSIYSHMAVSRISCGAASFQQQQQQQPAILLPRMPLGLQLITTAKTYEAVARACRALAAAAQAADAATRGASASGTALCSLVDGCIRRLWQVVEARTGTKPRSKRSKQSAAAGPAMLDERQPWQLQTAAIISVLSELLLGASPAWQQQQDQWQQGSNDGNTDLESIIATASSELVQEAIWSLPTSVAMPITESSTNLLLLPSLSSGANGGLSAQQLGCNALLLRAAAECCGTAARALGPRFAASSRLLRAVLLPLLEKLGKVG